MAEASIPVHSQPGQVFACIGFVEAAQVLLGGAEAAFDWSVAGAARFRVRACGDASPVGRVLEFLSKASAAALAPAGSATLESWAPSWGPAPTSIERMHGYPVPDPPSPATLVCVLHDGAQSISIDYWVMRPSATTLNFGRSRRLSGRRPCA